MVASWRDSIANSYVGARKWGTGINPVHSIKEDGTSMGRNLAPGPYNGLQHDELIGYEDWGYGEDVNMGEVNLAYTEAHPNLGDRPPRARTNGFPSWNMNGQSLRAEKVGMAWKEQMPLQVPVGPAGYGWRNKEYASTPLESDQPDNEQLFMNTSMHDMNLPRVNDRAVARGTDEPRAQIAPRILGMREKVWSGGQRHDDMQPREQNVTYHRPFLYRTAGTGPAEWMEVNEMYVSEPIQRSLPQDVDMGGYESEMGDTGSDYTDEGDFY